jgi:hypothetical protein
MTSRRKLEANRANARASTGPKSMRGRTRAAQNARRHGLSLSVLNDSKYTEEIITLANEISGIDACSEIKDSARRIAEAQIDLIRIRRARYDLMARNITDPHYREWEVYEHNTKITKTIVRLIGMTTPIPPILRAMFHFKPEGPHKIVAILSDLSGELTKMDRYERRALSRRKFAIRDFDVARQARSGYSVEQ